MHYIETSSEYAEQAVTEALQEGQWLIGCMADDPHVWSTYTLENVFRYEGEGHWAIGLDIVKKQIENIIASDVVEKRKKKAKR